jgi:hypothetical protein
MVGIQKATVFSAYTTAFTYLQRKDPETRKANVAKAGIFAGVVGSVLLGPVDQLKIAMQIQKGKGDAVKTFRSTVTDLYGAHGFVRGIYGGYQSVFVREIFGYAIYFSVFDGLTQAWKHKYSTDNTISFTGQLLVGGTTGTVCWSLYYPLDVIKSRAHVWSMTAGKPALSFPKVAETIYKTRGVAGFYQGMLPAVIRGFPTHATVLTSYGLLMKWLPGAEEDTE